VNSPVIGGYNVAIAKGSVMAARRGGVRRTCVIAVVCAVLGVGWTPAAVAADGTAGTVGKGTTSDPFDVSAVDQLQAIEEDLDAH